MGSLIGLLVGKSIFGHVIGEKMARALAYAGLVLGILALMGAAVCAIRKDAVDDHEAKVVTRSIPATNKAADERANDTIKQAKNEAEAHDAIEAQPDQPISPTSRALACKRLRDAGRNPAACGGPQSNR